MGFIRNTVAKLFKFDMRAVFAGAQGGRLFGDWITSPLSADQEIKGDLKKLRARARDLGRNNSYVRNYLNMSAANIVGHKGFKLQAKIRNNSGALAEALNEKIEEAWGRWSRAEFCTVTGRMNLAEACRFAVVTERQDGECFIRMVRGAPNDFAFALQFLDADLIDSDFNQPRTKDRNEIRLGIELDEWGKTVAFHVLTGHPSEASDRRRERILAADMIHFGDAWRVSQTRYVTSLAPAMGDLKILDGYVEAELVAARTGAAKMGWFEPDPEHYSPLKEVPRISMDASPGVAEVLPPGMTFKEWSPDHPAAAFPAFLKACLRRISSGWNVNYNAVANDLEGVNYSSLRDGAVRERDTWRVHQDRFISMVLTRIYDAWLPMAMLTGELVLDSRDPKRFRDVTFQPRGWSWVDPLKDGQAAVLAIQNALTTRTKVVSEDGEDFGEILEELATEEEQAKALNVKLPQGGTNQPNPGNNGGNDPNADPNADPNQDPNKEGA